jgi:photosystem II stability/assembly factor-like uncharacterized protein
VVAHQGELYAFMLGVGLLRTEEGARDWQVVKRDWAERYLMHLAVDPDDPSHLLAADDQGQLLRSSDGGKEWAVL